MRQLDIIFSILGTPTPETWPGVQNLKLFEDARKKEYPANRLEQFITARCAKIDEVTLDLIKKLLSLDPNQRLSATEALAHPYFSTEPIPCSPSEIPKVEGDAHEYTIRN
jgi:serine/threonine protein kinase